MRLKESGVKFNVSEKSKEALVKALDDTELTREEIRQKKREQHQKMMEAWAGFEKASQGERELLLREPHPGPYEIAELQRNAEEFELVRSLVQTSCMLTVVDDQLEEARKNLRSTVKILSINSILLVILAIMSLLGRLAFLAG